MLAQTVEGVGTLEGARAERKGMDDLHEELGSEHRCRCRFAPGAELRIC